MVSKVDILKRLLLGSTLITTLFIGVIATKASFTDTIPATVNVSAGVLTIEGEGASRVHSDGKTVTDMVTTHKLVPNQVVSNDYKIINSGNLDVAYTISTASATPTPSIISQRVQVTIKSGSEVLYTGSLSTISTESRVLNAGQSETLTINTSLPVVDYYDATNFEAAIDQNTRIRVSGKVAS